MIADKITVSQAIWFLSCHRKWNQVYSDRLILQINKILFQITYMWITVGRQCTLEDWEIYWLRIKRSAIHYPAYLISPIWNGKMMTWNKIRNIKVPILIVLNIIYKNTNVKAKLSRVILKIPEHHLLRGFIYCFWNSSDASTIKLSIECHDKIQKYSRSWKEERVISDRQIWRRL